MSTKTIVGFIGLGSMGLPMARNLLAAGFPLRVYNRTAEKTAELLKLGAAHASSPAHAAHSGGILVSMVSDDRALEQISAGPDGVARALAPGGVHLSMSTVSPATSRRIADLHQSAGSSYIAAPVFGRPDAAAAKKLWICYSGPALAKGRIIPLLEAVGQGHFDLGEDPAAASIVKAAGNLMIVCAIEAFAEALALAQKNGIGRAQFVDVMTHSIFASPFYQNYGQLLASENYAAAGFRLALALKDINLVLAAGTASATPLPFAGILRDRLLSAVARGRGEMDMTAMALGVSESAGLTPSPQTAAPET